MIDHDEFWKRHALRDAQDPQRNGFMTPDFEHFVIGLESDRGIRGFGGIKFLITYEDGTTRTTTNLWAQGQVPEQYRNEFKVRASRREIL